MHLNRRTLLRYSGAAALLASVRETSLVAAESTATLAAAGIPGPTIAMLEQPWSQDACQAAELQIALSGEATG